MPLPSLIVLLLVFQLPLSAASLLYSELIFPLESWHNHGSCIVEAPNGDLIVCWFHGSGERKADDVVILGARKDTHSNKWSKPFLLADTPEFPDTNCCMIIDPQDRLWLLWPTIQANLWESALMNYKISNDYQRAGEAPRWQTEKVLHMKPGDTFPLQVRKKTADYLSNKELDSRSIEWAANNFKKADDKLTRRLGWFTRAHPYITEKGRMLVGLYSDGFSFSLVAYTDDWGQSWGYSEPIVGGGNIQPSFARKRDGTLVSYMRDNGPQPKRVHVSESTDQGQTWSKVYDHPELPNPGTGLELINLNDGRFLTIYNDTERGRHSLAVSISNDEGRSFQFTRHLELAPSGQGSFHYPSIIQGKNGQLHASYSYFVNSKETGASEKSIKYATFGTDWVEEGD
ncbi:MAG: neuraminidase (sialidase)-like protein [Verrucomicrobia bacterium]|jgi:predicted neuraminidase|nr:neuraminidase (sialidase)-like protein [Verrucomicrobiota bacterium]MDA7644846.1 exo-alpha-sialidase [bacterium]